MKQKQSHSYEIGERKWSESIHFICACIPQNKSQCCITIFCSTFLKIMHASSLLLCIVVFVFSSILAISQAASDSSGIQHSKPCVSQISFLIFNALPIFKHFDLVHDNKNKQTLYSGNVFNSRHFQFVVSTARLYAGVFNIPVSSEVRFFLESLIGKKIEYFWN